MAGGMIPHGGPGGMGMGRGGMVGGGVPGGMGRVGGGYGGPMVQQVQSGFSSDISGSVQPVMAVPNPSYLPASSVGGIRQPAPPYESVGVRHLLLTLIESPFPMHKLSSERLSSLRRLKCTSIIEKGPQACPLWKFFYCALYSECPLSEVLLLQKGLQEV